MPLYPKMYEESSSSVFEFAERGKGTSLSFNFLLGVLLSALTAATLLVRLSP